MASNKRNKFHDGIRSFTYYFQATDVYAYEAEMRKFMVDSRYLIVSVDERDERWFAVELLVLEK